MLDFNSAPRQHLTAISPEDWERRVDRLRDALKASCHDIVRHVFPRARINSHEARIGNVQGDAGESLSISMKGEERGLWMDHATGEHGDLIDLWRDSSGMSFRETVEDLEKFCGLSSAPRFASRIHVVGEQRKAVAAKEPKVEQPDLGSPSQVWTYFAPDGETRLAQVRRYDMADGDKTYRPFLPSGAAGMPDPRPLYRLPDIRSAETVVFCEGEKCADALASLGIESTSAMGGANTSINKIDWSPLAGKKVILWPDNDKPGRDFMDRVTPILEGIGCDVRLLVVPKGKPEKWDAADAVAEGFDVHGLIMPEASADKPLKYKLLDVDALENLEPVEWLVDGAIPVSGFVGLYGPSGGLKSFAAVDMALCIATGRDWHGKAVKRGCVVYIAGEGQRGLAKRVMGWRRHKPEEGRPDFHMLPSSVSISSEEDLQEVSRTLASLPIKPCLIVIDTLARNFGPGDENSQKDMGAFIRGIDALIYETGAAVMVVHHTGKDVDRGERGSSAFRGAVDSLIFCRRNQRKLELINQAPFGKQKDAEEFEDVRLFASTVEFAHAGETERTLVLVPDDSPDAPQDDQEDENAPRLGKIEKAVMKAMEKADREGQALGFTRLVAMASQIHGSEINKGSFSRATKSLVEKRLIEERSDNGKTYWVFP